MADNQRQQSSVFNPPAPPTLAAALNTVRMNYMNLFNQILDTSINVKCICKTTNKIESSKKNDTKVNNKNVFDQNVHGFMSDDEEENEDKNKENIKNNDENENDVEMIDYLNMNETRLYELDTEQNERNICMNRICDLSCFENMRYVHFVLKNCFHQVNEENLDEKLKRFDDLWSNFKFLSKNPKSCDYFGTTIFHYAAAENYEVLKYSLLKYPNGVFCVDSKGMTPLMRAVQRNNLKCVKFLLNDTQSDINGSIQSASTPLWFAVTNGHDDLALLLLNFNANPSIVNKPISISSNPIRIPGAYDPTESLNQNEDFSEIGMSQSENHLMVNQSPLRLSIAFSRFEIMIFLLNFNANVNELFWTISSNPNSHQPNTLCYNLKINEEYVNSLRFLHRHFGEIQGKNDIKIYLNKLNNYIENPNVYRRMFIEFVKKFLFEINSNLNLVDKLNEYLNSSNMNSIEYIVKMTRMIEIEEENELYLSWNNYVSLIQDFINSFVTFSNLRINYIPKIRSKAAYNKQLFDFSLFLIEKFFRPKSLKELCRFTIRAKVFDHIKTKHIKYEDGFLKSDHLSQVVDMFDLPSQLKNFTLFK